MFAYVVAGMTLKSQKKSAMCEKRPRCERSENYLKIRDVRIRDGRKRDERDLPVSLS